MDRGANLTSETFHFSRPLKPLCFVTGLKFHKENEALIRRRGKKELVLFYIFFYYRELIP